MELPSSRTWRGRVWTGVEALELGLADEVGGFDEALRKARDLGKAERDAPEALIKISLPAAVVPRRESRRRRPARWSMRSGTRSSISARYAWAVSPYDIHARIDSIPSSGGAITTERWYLSASPRKDVDRRAMSVLSAGHLFTDLNQGAGGAAPVPRGGAGLHFSGGRDADARCDRRLLFVQPLFGIFSDNRPLPALMSLGVLSAGAGMSSLASPPAIP